VYFSGWGEALDSPVNGIVNFVYKLRGLNGSRFYNEGLADRELLECNYLEIS